MALVLNCWESANVVDSTLTINKPTAGSANGDSPKNAAVGDLLIIVIGSDDNTDTPQWDDNLLKPTGFTLINEAGESTRDCHCAAFYKIVDGGEGASFDVPAQSSDDLWGSCILISSDDNSPIFYRAGPDVADSTPSPISITGVYSARPNAIAFYVAAYDGGDDGGFSVAGDGWVERAEVRTGTGQANGAGCWGTHALSAIGATGAADVTPASSDGMVGFQFVVSEDVPEEDGFEAADPDLTNGDGGFWDSGEVNAATMVGDDETVVHGGTYSAKFVGDAASDKVYAHHILGSLNNNAYARFYLNVDSLTADAATRTADILLARNGAFSAGNRLVVRIQYASAATFKLQIVIYKDGGTETITGTTVLDVDTWYCIEARYFVDGAVGGAELWIDGISEISNLDNDTEFADSQVERWLLGAELGFNFTALVAYYDDFKCHTDYIGPEATSTELVISEATHAHSADSPVLTQAHELAVSEATHAQAADSPVLTQAHTLAVGEATHAHSTDGIDLVEHKTLAVDEAGHAQSVDGIALTQTHQLDVAEASHAHNADSPVLTQVHNLAVADADHAHSADSPVLTQAHALAVDESSHSHSADNVTLDISVTLVVQDGTHGHSVESPVLSQAHVLDVQEATHGHAADALTLTQAHMLTAQESSHAHSTDAIVLEQAHYLAVAEAAHAQSVDPIILAQAHQLAVSDGGHAHTTDGIVLVVGGGGITLVVSESFHAQSADAPVLSQKHFLVTQEATHVLSDDFTSLASTVKAGIPEMLWQSHKSLTKVRRLSQRGTGMKRPVHYYRPRDYGE